MVRLMLVAAPAFVLLSAISISSILDTFSRDIHDARQVGGCYCLPAACLPTSSASFMHMM